MSWAIGSLRGAATVCVAGGASAEWAARRLSRDLGRTAPAAGGGALTKNGAGREPDCRTTALTMMMRLAATAARMANESTGRRAALAHSRKISDPAILAAPTPTHDFRCGAYALFLTGISLRVDSPSRTANGLGRLSRRIGRRRAREDSHRTRCARLPRARKICPAVAPARNRAAGARSRACLPRPGCEWTTRRHAAAPDP